MLFCLYARARWGDAQRVERLVLDGDLDGEDFYVQAEAKDVKTASVTAHRNVFLPMVMTGPMLISPSWVDRWLKLRAKLQADLARSLSAVARRTDG
eukprot:5426631-Amphidinium_carterae.1